MTSDTYIVNWNNIAKIWIEVDHTENMEKVLHSINKIWWDHEEMQSKTNGNVITVALKRIVGEFFKLMVDKDFGLEHLICRFNSNPAGYFTIDGSERIRVVGYEAIKFKYEEVTISKVGKENGK